MTGSGESVLLSTTSGPVATRVLAVAALLPAFGSGVSVVADAVFVMAVPPATAGSTCTTTVIVVDVPGDRNAKQVTVPVTGDLTMHGVTKRVTIPLTVAARGTTFEIVGSYAFPMSDFNITPPSVQPFVSVEPNTTLEFRLVLGR